LDYLVTLKKYQNGNNRQSIDGNEKHDFYYDKKNVRDSKRDIYVQFRQNQQNEIENHKNRDVYLKQMDKDERQQFLRNNDDVMVRDKQKILENKKLLNNIQQKEYEDFHRNKQMERDMNRQKQIEENKKNFEIYEKSINDRENNYRIKMEKLNGQIYDKVKSHNDFLKNNLDNRSINPSALENKNDFDFNKKMLEEKERQKVFNKDQYLSLADQRMLEVERQKQYDLGIKSKKNENMKVYKDILDSQNQYKSTLKNIDKNSYEEQKLLPGYNYVNRPFPNNKMAKDSIHLIKNNMLFENNEEFYAKNGNLHTLMDNKQKDFYLGKSNLTHNPIINPVSNTSFNKYLEKLKHKDLYSQSPNNNVNVRDSNTFQSTANNIIK